MTHIEINGRPVEAAQLPALLTNYGHFSSLQVRGGRVVGLALHLARLQAATRELFASELDPQHVLSLLRAALLHAGGAAIAASAVRITVYAAAFDRERPGASVAADVMITVAPPGAPKTAPIRVQAQAYERDLPQIKHVGVFGQLHQRRLAQQAGFDDALFVDRAGCISEGSVWNIGFWDGARVVWPQAAMLDGVSQQVLRQALDAHGIAQQTREIRLADLTSLQAAFCCNSNGVGTVIAAIDQHRFDAAADIGARLARVYAGVDAEALI